MNNACPFHFSFSLFRSREAGEWVNYSFDVKEGREYQMTLTRRQYRMEWPNGPTIRPLVGSDGQAQAKEENLFPARK